MTPTSPIDFRRRVFRKLQKVAGITPVDEFPHTNDVISDYNHVTMFYWRPQWTYTQNFGDHLSKMIVAQILASRERSLEEETPGNHTLFSIGSILQVAKNDEVIWGSGVNGCFEPEAYKFSRLDVRAVRGHKSADFLRSRGIKVPEVYGDPALLLPHVFPTRFKRTSKVPYAVIPHHSEEDILKQQNVKNIVSPMGSWNTIIEKILEADYVISSSLHGIIVAEAYGIPARYLRISDNQDLLKYNDYMSGTNRGDIEYATSVEQALTMGPQAPIVNFDHQKLLNSFPWDLWMGK